MDLIQSLLDKSEFPLATAFLLGLLVAIHPCPLATNIAAMGYIAKDVENPSRVFRNGMLYTLGRTISYTLLGVLLIAIIRGGVQTLNIGDQMSEWGERLLSPLLILIGLYLLYNDLLHKHDHVPTVDKNSKWNRNASHTGWWSLCLGIMFALAFCPESGIVYFGMLIPLSVESPIGYLLPVSFAVGTALPVVLLAWATAYSIHSSATVNKYMAVIKAWLTRVVAVLFILAGVFCYFF